MEIKLKRCPFCGGRAGLSSEGITNNYVFVQCKDCGARTKGFRIVAEYAAMDVAINEWNKRTRDDN